MLDVNLDINLDKVAANLNAIEQKQLPFAMAKGATDTAMDIKKAEQQEMKSVFDRPKPFTINSIRVTAAKKQKYPDINARVWFKDVSMTEDHYLTAQVFGGKRSAKRFEKSLRRKGILAANQYAVPGHGAKLDRYGNINHGQLIKALANLGAMHDKYSNTNKRSMNTKSNRAGMFFLEYENDKPVRISLLKGDDAIPFLYFVDNQSYKKRFKFFEVAEKIQRKNGKRNFDRALRFAFATSKR